jgi:aerobic carbon-monoxide dehydrogenase large subunit
MAMQTPTEACAGPGVAVRRVEDPALLTSTARFTGDLVAAGCLHAVFVRSSYAYARVTRISTGRARRAHAVMGVLTAHELGLGRLPAGGGPEVTRRPVLAGDTIRFLGEPLAVVVAQTRAAAIEAAELVEVDCTPLDPVVDPAAALNTGAPLVFPELGSNVVAHGTTGAGSALDGAEIVVRARFRNQRVAPVPLEPGGALAVPDADGRG